MPTKKSVLFIIESLNGGGAERVLIDLLSKFDYTRFDVTLLLIYRAGAFLDQIPTQIRLRWVWPVDFNIFHRAVNYFYPVKNLITSTIIGHALRGLGQFDTIISFLEGVSLHAHSLITSRGNRNVTWVHTNIQINNWTYWVFPSPEAEKRVYEQMDAVVFVSDGARNIFERKFGTSTGGLHRVIHNIVDCNEIIRKSFLETISHDRPIILTIGRFDHQKRHDRLLHAVNLLRDRGLEFTLGIVGSGSDTEMETKALAERLVLTDTVTFHGFKSNPYPYLRAADIFVMTSDTEGLSTVISEAICLGKPIVSTDTTGTRELLEGGVGILTDLTPEAVADALESLLRSPELRAEYSARALEASKRFSPEAAVKAVEDIIVGN